MQSKILKVNKEVFFNFDGYNDQEIESTLKFYTDGKDFLSPNIYITGRFAKYHQYPNADLSVQDLAKVVLAHCIYHQKTTIILMVENAANNGFATDLIAALNQHPKVLDSSTNPLIHYVLACKGKAWVIDDLKRYFSTYGVKHFYKRIYMEGPEQALKGSINISENPFAIFSPGQTRENEVDPVLSGLLTKNI